MRQKRLMILFFYLALLAACAGIVWLLGRLNSPVEPKTPSVQESEYPGQTEPSEEETPAGETEGEESLETEPETEIEEMEVSGRPEGTDKPRGQTEETPPYEPPRLMLVSDLHYMSGSTHDEGKAFWNLVKSDDGKAHQYSEQLLEALAARALEEKPSALVLSGDITLNGEKENHLELAKKLKEIQDGGVPVVVIPGNHDIQNHNAAVYFGDKKEAAEYLESGEEFYEIYHSFGYDQSPNRDPASLSYVYPVDPWHWLLMLDTCQYRPVAKVGGAILSETYYWIEEQLEEAWDEAMDVIPVAHHNLLEESKIYVDDCTIEHGEQLVDILDEWDVKLFLSGHLHVQHTMRSEDNRGVWEAVTASLATPACQYGVLTCRDDGSYQYGTWSVDVESWAGEHGRKERDLLEFRKFQEPFLRKVFYNQSMTALNAVPDIPEDRKKQMSDLYAKLNYYYYQGTAYQIKNEVLSDPAYRMWLNEGTLTVLGEYVEYIVSDAVQDYNRLVVD